MKQIRQLIKEVIPVFPGILIALVINNWNEERKDEKYLNKIYASIKEELVESKLDLEENLLQQERLLDSLQAYMNNESVSLLDIILKAGGIYGPRIKNNSWKAT